MRILDSNGKEIPRSAPIVPQPRPCQRGGGDAQAANSPALFIFIYVAGIIAINAIHDLIIHLVK